MTPEERARRKAKDEEYDRRTEEAIFRLFEEHYGYTGTRDDKSLALYKLKHGLYFHEPHGPYDDGGFGNFYKSNEQRRKFAKERGIPLDTLQKYLNKEDKDYY